MACHHCVTMAGTLPRVAPERPREDECLDEDEDNNFEVGEAMAPESFEMFLGSGAVTAGRMRETRLLR